MNLFYQPLSTQQDHQIVFSKEESRHLHKVLRKSVGDIIHVTNGKGDLFTTELIAADPKKCVAIIKNVESTPPLAYGVHLAVAPTKLNDRYEWFLEKATEIGITHITPIICKHSERTVIKPERYEKIIVAAMKQSLHYHKPILEEAISFKEFIAKSHSETLKCIAHCEEDQPRTLLKDCLQPSTDTLIIIGPEGDFSKEEIKASLQEDFIPVSLGNTRLRTETAAVVGCHSIAFVNQ